LDEPNKRYQAYITELQKWTEKRTGLVGNSEIADSIEGYRSQLKKLEEIPAQVAARKQRRIEKVKEIYDRVAGLANDYRQYYRPVRDFIQNHPLAKDKLQLNFEVSIVDTTFRDKFFDYVHQGVSGSFFGDKEGKSVLENIIEKYDFNDWARARGFLQDVIDHLENDKRPGASAKVRIAEQLKKGHTVQELYDFVFSLAYLSPRYTLRLGDRDLHQLSPGEKGTLLLIFYLLVDRGDVPLVIDQPEENLDNQTVVSLLVPCIKEAKQRRQILIVTHNPNLAVVCDAEQIVYASENKKGRKRIAYTSGAIENPIFNKKTVDVLEGTRPAFDNRDSKYFPEGTP
jgi:predicted ATPase